MKKKDLYAAELIFNLKRFVDSDVISHPTSVVDEIPKNCFISQVIKGDYNALTALYADEEALALFAQKYCFSLLPSSTVRLLMVAD